MKFVDGLKKNPLSVLVHIAAWGLLAWQAGAYFSNNLGVNPVQALTQHLGKYALIFLVLSLACTPVNLVFGLRQVLSLRRSLGLYTFMFASLHFLTFIGLDYAFNVQFLWQDVANKRYIWMGAGALLILTPMAVTSFKWWMKRMGKNWKRLHRLVYLAGVLVIVHYAWAKKGDLFSLQGDVRQPFVFGVLLLLLLALRLPVVRTTVSHWRSRARQRWAQISRPQSA
ncbi:MAG: protein-methionine-sulfoxide reductase heme-binding subunit MsrQ [Chloroflexota bacterium]